MSTPSSPDAQRSGAGPAGQDAQRSGAGRGSGRAAQRSRTGGSGRQGRGDEADEATPTPTVAGSSGPAEPPPAGVNGSTGTPVPVAVTARPVRRRRGSVGVRPVRLRVAPVHPDPLARARTAPGRRRRRVPSPRWEVLRGRARSRPRRRGTGGPGRPGPTGPGAPSPAEGAQARGPESGAIPVGGRTMPASGTARAGGTATGPRPGPAPAVVTPPRRCAGRRRSTPPTNQLSPEQLGMRAPTTSRTLRRRRRARRRR